MKLLKKPQIELTRAWLSEIYSGHSSVYSNSLRANMSTYEYE